MKELVNLRERYGDRYRVYLEEPAKSYADPWYHVIPCQFGHIYPHGGDELGFACKTRGGVAKRLAAPPFTRVTQDATDGMNIVFPSSYFATVARIVKPRKRRRLSDEQKAIAAERLRKYQPTKGQTVQDIARQRSKTVPKRAQTVSDDSEH